MPKSAAQEKKAVEFCPGHHLVDLGAVIEKVDLLCNSLPQTRAKDIRKRLTRMQHSLESAKADSVELFREQVEAQQKQLSLQQNVIEELRATVDNQQA